MWTKKLLLSAFLALFAVSVSAQQLVSWDVNSLTGYGSSPLSPSSADPAITVVGLTRGSGVGTGGTAANGGWGGIGWNHVTAQDAITAQAFVTFSLTPVVGKKVDVTSLNPFKYRRSSSGATEGLLQYKIGNGNFTDLTILSFSNPSGSGAILLPVDLSSIPDINSGETLTFRLVPYGATASGGTFYIFDRDNSSNASDLSINGTVTTVIVPPALSISDVTLPEGNSGQTVFTFTASLSSPAPVSGVTFDVSTADGTATAGSDYTAVNLTGVNIPEGQSSTTIEVLVNGDTDVEADETFYVNISNISNNATLQKAQGVGTITDDDDLPTLSINDLSLQEGNSGTTEFNFTVTLSSQAPAGGVTFDVVTEDHTATAGTDYTAVNLIGVSIAEGETTAEVIVLVNGNTVHESDKIFYVNLSNATSNATLDKSQGIGTIVNDDLPLPTLSINDVSLPEGNSGTTEFTFTVTLSSPAPAGGVTFDVSTEDHTATAGTDYTAVNLTSVDIAEGETTTEVVVLVNGNTAPESNKVFHVNISNVNNATLDKSQGIGTILNDDYTIPTLSINDVSAPEGNSGTTSFAFTVTLSSAAPAGGVSFDVATQDHTAIAGTDYTAVTLTGVNIAEGETTSEVIVLVTGNTSPEADKVFYVNLSNAVNAAITKSQGIGTILDDDAPLVSWNVSGLSGYGSSPLAPSQAHSAISVVGFTRGSGVGTGGSAAGRAWGGTSWNHTTAQAAITAQSYITFSLTPSSGKKIKLTSINPFDYRRPNSGPTEGLLQYQIGSGSFVDVANLSFPSNNSGGAAHTPIDLSSIPEITPEETLTFRLIPFGASGSTGTFYIFDRGNSSASDFSINGTVSDFIVVPALSINDVTLFEGNSGQTVFTFTASLSSPAPVGGVTFDLSTTDGTAAAGSDYTAVNLSGVSIPEGQSSTTIEVLVNGDTDIEADETFFVNISNISSNATLNKAQGIGTITDDDDLPKLSINDVSLPEGNTGTTEFSFTVTLSRPAPIGGITFEVATEDHTATAGTDYTAINLTTASIAEGETSTEVVVLVNGDTEIETDEIFYVNISNAPDATITQGQGTGTILDDDTPFPATRIHAIQGSGMSSTVQGSVHTIEAIVTRIFAGSSQLNGFYVQEEDEDADNDPETSEGLFIYDPTGMFTGNIGDKVRVEGSVNEYVTTNGSLTQLRNLNSVTVVSTGNDIPTPAELKLPVAQLNDLERFEGMLVNVSATVGNVVVSDHYNLARYGQVILSVDGSTNATGTDGRLDQYTQFNSPSIAGNAAYLEALKLRQIYLDDASSAQNPDPVIFARGGNPLSASNPLRAGDGVASLIAILDHRFEGYRLQTRDGIDFQPLNPRPTTSPVFEGSTLRIGAMNVLNYFNGDGTGGGFPTSRGAHTLVEFNRQRDKIISAILGANADVLTLMEIENDGYGANSAIQDLVNGLNAVAGANTYSFINPGVTTATDVITVGMIYKPSKVVPEGSAAVIPSSYGTGAHDLVGRKPLAQSFKQLSNNEIFTAVALHFKSKGSLSPGSGNADNGDGQGNNNLLRTQQATELASWLATNPTGVADSDVIILGDFNAYAMEDPMTYLASEGYENLHQKESYSYSFDGMWGSLDHAIGSGSLKSQMVGAKKWNINADESRALDYNTEFKTNNQISSYYAPDPFKSSDHDIVLVGLNLLPICVGDLVLQTTITTNQTAGNSITGKVANKIPTNEKVSYQAGAYILLQPGFTAESGAVFEATIKGCRKVE